MPVQRVRVQTPEGVREYPVYNDNRELAADYESGVLKSDEEFLYRGIICCVIDKFVDEDGKAYTELLFKGTLGPIVQMQMM